MSSGEQAFSVFCDEAVRHAVENTNRLVEENASTEPIWSLLNNIEVRLGRELLKKINISNRDQDDEEEGYFVYSTNDIEVPYAKIKSLFLSLAGAAILADTLRMPPRMNVIHDSETPSIEMTLDVTSDVRVYGILTGFEGSLEDVEDMIRCNVHTVLFTTMGMINAQTGQPVQPAQPHPIFAHFGDPLRGAIVSIKQIEIAKKRCTTALRCNEIPICEAEMEPASELQNLAIANPSHDRLVEVTESYLRVLKRNAVLKACRETAQTFHVRAGDSHIPFKLETGHKQRFGNKSVWSMPPACMSHVYTIPMEGVANLSVTLAGQSWSSSVEHTFGITVTADFCLIVPYGHFLSVAFAFDSSIDGVDWEELELDPLNYIRALLNRSRGITTAVNGQELNLVDHGLTMQLLSIHIDFDAIKGLLNLLDIDELQEHS